MHNSSEVKAPFQSPFTTLVETWRMIRDKDFIFCVLMTVKSKTYSIDIKINDLDSKVNDLVIFATIFMLKIAFWT